MEQDMGSIATSTPVEILSGVCCEATAVAVPCRRGLYARGDTAAKATGRGACTAPDGAAARQPGQIALGASR